MQNEFADCVAVVTGAGSRDGIGYATCARLHQLGAKVFALDLDFQENAHAPWATMRCDVSDFRACQGAIQEIMDQHGKINVLVNNAGIISATRIADMASEDFQGMLEVNAVGVFNVTQAALEGLKKCQGAIVNVASIAAQRGGGVQGGAHYAASKGAVASFTKACAREFGQWGIRANYVNPGIIQTGMTKGKFTGDQVSAMQAQIPLGRLGTADEVASAITFLASSAAAYVSGAALDVNGGFHIH